MHSNHELNRKLTALVVSSIIVLSFLGTVELSRAVSASSVSASWANLYGAEYMWGSLFDIWGTEAPAPATSLPMLQADGGMNFLRVSLEWYTYTENPTTFISSLQTLATVANQYNFKIVYEFNSYEEATFPLAVQTASGCGTGGSAGSSEDICFTAAYLTDAFSVSGQTVWAYQMSNFWSPVISAVDSYSSTAGYEFANEPYNYYTDYGVSNTNLTNIAAYNGYFSNQIRALTSKPIVVNLDPWLYNDYNVNYGGNTLVPPAGDCTVAGSCVIDIHWYILSEGSESSVSGMDTYLSANAAEANTLGMPIFVGEFAPCDSDCSLTNSAAQTAINEQVSGAKNYSMGQAFFAWSCNYDNDPNDWIDMLNSSCTQQNIVGTLVSNSYTSIMEGTSTTSSTTATTSTTTTTSKTSTTRTTSTTTSTTTRTTSTTTRTTRSRSK